MTAPQRIAGLPAAPFAVFCVQVVPFHTHVSFRTVDVPSMPPNATVTARAAS